MDSSKFSNDPYFHNKTYEFVIENLDKEIMSMNDYLKYLDLSLTDFSSALRLEIEEMLQNYERDFFTAEEGRNIIFNDVLTNKFNDGLNYEKIEFLLKKLKFYSEYLIKLKDKLESDYIKEKKNYNKLLEYTATTYNNINKVINELESISFSNNYKNENYQLYHLGNESIINDKLEKLRLKKKKYDEILLYKEELIKKKSLLNKKLTPMKNIPNDKAILKELIKNLKENYYKTNN